MHKKLQNNNPSSSKIYKCIQRMDQFWRQMGMPMLYLKCKICGIKFASGIAELIQEKILLINGDIVKTKNQNGSIPSWFKNTALWYSEGIITEDDFLLGLQYLIEKEIIVI